MRNRAVWRTIVSVAVLLCVSGRLANAQAAKDTSGPGASVSLGAVSGTAKNEVAVPLMLTPQPSDTRIGGIEMTVAYESPYVVYQRTEKGFLLDGVGGVIDAREVKDPDNAKKSRVILKVETKGGSGKSLPDGLILTLIFEVKANAVPKVVVPLKIEKLTVTEAGSGVRALHGSVEKNGSIEVILPEEVPVMPCFFFSH
jgi:cohesin domain-containing protein